MDEHEKFVGMTKGQFMILIASIFAAAMIISISVLSLSLTTAGADVQELQAVSKRVEANSHRSCHAIRGAVKFWRLVLSSTETALKDPAITPIARKANILYVAALKEVIRKGSALPC